MSSIVSRNLKIYFRDKSAVFFSLLGILITVGLYFLFLGDTYTDGLADFNHPEIFMAGWIMSGLLSITSVTTTMGAFGTMVQDKEKKIYKDFYCSPIKRSVLTMGYIISSAVVGLIMTAVVLVITVVYLAANEAIVISAMLVVKMILLSALTSLSNTAMALFIVSLINSEKAFSAISGVMSALIGFLTGIYIPVGNLDEGVQMVVKCFPTSHSAVLFRQILMENSLNEGVKSYPAAAQAEALAEVKDVLGVVFKFGETECSAEMSLLILVGALVVFSSLSIFTLNRKKTA
ncbi:MAG: ABC transporter permease [Ruminococcus sp.]|nr:ABC transporter permease [Ruminococcus sp.]